MNSHTWKLVQRYRPYLLLAVLVLAVTILPTRGSGTRGVGLASGNGLSANAQASGAANAGSGPAVAGGPVGETTTPGSDGTNSSGGPGAQGGASGGSPGALGLGATPANAGVGSADALHGPFCDPKYGRIRFPVYFREPCVTPWAKGTPNGGATAPGVSATEITVSIVSGGTSVDTDSNRAEVQQAWKDIFDIWAGSHETYGRKLKLVFNDFGSGGQAPDDAQQRSMAVQVAGQKPFAALLMSTGDVLPQELARRGIVTFVPTGTGAWNDFQAFPGLLWGQAGATEPAVCLTAKYVQKLIGKPAKWAGTPDLTVKTRKFALMYAKNADAPTINNCLKSAGYTPDLTIVYDPDAAAFQTAALTYISKMKSAGITTILGGAGEFFNLATLTKQATSQAYYPEWVINGQASDDLDFIVRSSADQAQARHFFGFGVIPPGSASGTAWFSSVIDWYYGADHRPSWFGKAPGTGPNSLVMMNDVRSLLSGVHLAGPNLNVKTFTAARFSIPAYGGAACGCLTLEQEKYGTGVFPPGLGDVSYMPQSDQVEFWWDPTTVGPDSVGVTTGPGLWRYMYSGQRRKLGDFLPGEPPAFSNGNTITNNDTQAVPPPDRAANPPYPCRVHNPGVTTADAYHACPSGT